MRRFPPVCIPVLLALAVSGCVSRPEPYRNSDGWYIRQNATPQYFADYDVFYLHPELYAGGPPSTDRYDYAYRQTVGLFGNRVRIFAPLCHDGDDVRRACEWYLDNYHDDGRPFVFIAEGVNSALLEPLVEGAKKEGLVGCWLLRKDAPASETAAPVDAGTVSEINETVRRWKYRKEWGREP